ncbi:MAG: hypothetical protein HUJ75_00495, partial [Parasporobacterium sp.]|nr:hypothetical protein [Parasporobacterium sp.]
AEYDKAVTNYTVADLLHSKDTTDTYYSDRRVAEEDTVNKMCDAALTAAHQVTLGPCADALKEHVGDSVYEQLEDYEPKTEQELAWDKRLSELATEYDGLAAAYGSGSEEFNEKAGQIYLEMVKIRTELAKSKGYDSYAQYADAEEYCRGISEEDLKVFRDSVKQLAPNFYYLIYNTTAYFGFEYSYVDFTDEQLIDALKKYAGKISSNAAEAADYMTENNLCDTGRDANRLDGCFATYLRTAQSPFIFVTSSGNRTFVSITHEFGHFTDFYLHGEGTGFATAPFILDVAEMASNGLQTLYTEYYDDIYGSDMSEYAITSNLIDLLMNLIDGCIYDEFQREVYAHPDWTIEQINACYQRVAESYGDPYGSSDSTVWMQVNHNFSVPMYYVSYALSAYGVIQIWDTMQTDFSAACDQWNKVVETGSTVYTFPEMMDYMGMHGITDKQYIFNVVTRLNDFVDSHSYSLYE